jgi:uncharacterized OsmC-like protein
LLAGLIGCQTAVVVQLEKARRGDEEQYQGSQAAQSRGRDAVSQPAELRLDF